MTDRDDAVHAGWLNGKKVRPEEIQASHNRFEQEFFMLLSTEQRLVFINNKARLTARGH